MLGQSFKNIGKNAAAALLSSAIVLPAFAHHNDDNDLMVYGSDGAHTEYTVSLQERFQDAADNTRIVIMDRDWLQINFVLNNVRVDNRELRNRYLAEHVLQQGDVHLPVSAFDRLENEIIRSSYAHHFELPESVAGGGTICMVYGRQQTMDMEQRIRRFLNLSPALHGEDGNRDVKEIIDLETYGKFTDYHEIGHCFDNFYGPQLRQLGTDYRPEYAAEILWKMESYADAFSILMLAKEHGITDVAEKLADLRLAASALQGPVTVQMIRSNTLDFHNNMIYLTHNALRAAQAEIDRRGVEQIRTMSDREIAELAFSIAEANTADYGFHSHLAASGVFHSRYDPSLWARLKEDTPFIAERFEPMMELRADMERAVRNVVDFSDIPEDEYALQGVEFTFDLSALVPIVSEAEYEGLRDGLAVTLYEAAGGEEATLETLAAAYLQAKDEWRTLLANGSDEEKTRANKNMAIGMAALLEAAKRVAPDNFPEPAVPEVVTPPAEEETAGAEPVDPEAERQKQERRAQIEQMIQEMAQELIEEAGGDNATPETLNTAYLLKRNQLAAMLNAGNADAQAAVLQLQLLPIVIMHAGLELEDRIEAGRDNTPVPTGP